VALLAWTLWVLSLVGAVATVLDEPSVESFMFGAMFLVFGTVGLVLMLRVPQNSVGWILACVGALGGIGGIASLLAFGLVGPEHPGAGFARWLLSWFIFPIIGLITIPLLLLFPTGRLLSPRWRFAMWMAPLFVLVASVGAAFYPWPPEEGGPNPYALEGAEETLLFLQDVSVFPLLIGIVAALASIVIRYRRGSEVERQQLKWFLAAAATVPVAILAGDQAQTTLQVIVVPVAFSLLPIAIAVAILRYRLYDIDRIINRALVYGVLTASLMGVYLGTVVTLQLVLRSVTGQQSQLVVVASTLAVAALFNPLRRRFQEFIDRRFYRKKYDAAKTLEAFSATLRDETDLDALRIELLSTVQRAMQPEHASLWLREPEEKRPEAER
jgi:hypothetical protein